MVIIFVRLVRCATGAGDGQDAAEAEDLEESGPGPGSVAAAESLFLCSAGSWLCPLIVTLGLSWRLFLWSRSFSWPRVPPPS